MPATPIRSLRIPQDPPSRHAPLIPTVVVVSAKGGVGKTALTVAIAERFRVGPVRVLLLTCDSQEDARHRLGCRRLDPAVARRGYGPDGSITVIGIRGEKAIDCCIESDRPAGNRDFDPRSSTRRRRSTVASCPVCYYCRPSMAPTRARNLLTMLSSTPSNTDIVLVRIGRDDPRTGSTTRWPSSERWAAA